VRAAVCRSYGPPSVVAVEELPSPTVGPGEVRVRVQAAAVNFPDVLIVADQYQMKAELPFVPGSEFAGVLDDGRRVFGSTFVGAFAEEVVVAEGAVTPIPDGVDDVTAAAFGVAHRTAWHVLRSVTSLQDGEELVVLGAGGGVGLAAVQLGAVLGARVTAVASSAEKLAAAESLGAAVLIDHTAGDLRSALRERLPEGSDVVVDPVGGALAEPALRSLRYGGRFVTVGYAGGEIPRIPLNLVMLKGIQLLGFQFLTFALNEPEALARNEAELLELLVAGKAVPHVGATFPLEETAAALQLVADGQAIGKVVVTLG